MNDYPARFPTHSSARQDALLWQHCGDIVEKLKSAGNAEAARGIAEEACASFGQTCASVMLRNALTRYVLDALEKEYGREIRREMEKNLL